MEEYFYAILDEQNVCVGIMQTIQKSEDTNKIELETLDNDKMHHSYIDGVWSDDVIVSYEETTVSETPSIESLAEKIEQLTKILEENNITI